MTGLFDLTGKTALVTGGANGMGAMIARGLLQAGAAVIVTSRKAADAEAAQQALGEFGKAEGLAADLASSEGAEALAAKLVDRGDPLHIVINNAGKTFGAPLDSFPAKGWDGVMMVNVQAPFTLVRDLLPLLRAHATPDDPARVINIGSVAGARVENLPAYSYAASKAAIHHLSRVLAVELAGDAITVNSILPGYFPTKMTSHIRSEEQAMSAMLDHIPLRRMGRPEDIAGACVFLSAASGAYVTGISLPVDGGILAAG
ncbi:SDR family oxidoreductase [Mesobacterium pallidum]|uniref:SDR family oxidoreductase n=1 Tax=Mesobacterium pallidum TaxID=2872037 RepID=UPI001EE34710|nr:SDR family oxidoreductase [Mesobacterium pallidum]